MLFSNVYFVGGDFNVTSFLNGMFFHPLINVARHSLYKKIIDLCRSKNYWLKRYFNFNSCKNLCIKDKNPIFYTINFPLT